MPFSCFLFHPRKSRERRRKRSHTNVSSTLSTRSSTPPAQTPHVRFHERKWVHTRLSEKNRTQRLARRNSGLPALGHSTVLCCQRNCHRKNSRRKWMHALRRVSASSGIVAPRGCGIFFASAEVAACTPCAQGFPNVRDEGWYHYPRRALCAVETPDGRLSKRLTCRFLRSGGRSSPHDSYFLANTQNFLLAVPVANAFALWYDIIFSHLPSLGNAGGY